MRFWYLNWVQNQLRIFVLSRKRCCTFAGGTTTLSFLCSLMIQIGARDSPSLRQTTCLSWGETWKIRNLSKVMIYECGSSISLSAVISMQPLVTDHANDPHMKAKDVPFHIWYGGLICIKAFQSDIPKWGGLFADPRWTSVCKTEAKQWLSGVKTGGVSASLPVTWLFLWVGYAIIPLMKEDIQGYMLIWKSGP